MNTSLHMQDDCVMLSATGEIDVSNTDEFKTALWQAIDKAQTAVCVDMAEVSYIDSTGIGKLIAANAYAKEKDIAFSLKNLQTNVARVFNLLHVDAEMEIN